MNWTKKLIAFLIVFLLFLPLLKGLDLIVDIVSHAKIKTPYQQRRLILREYGPNVDQLMVPSNDYMKNAGRLEQKAYRLRTDANGFIIGDRDLSVSDKAPVDFIFWGGSTTECLYVDEDKRFPYLVGQRLGKHDNSAIRVLNGGFSGNHSIHSLFNHLAKGLEQKPKFIVILHVANDLITLSKTLSYWEAPSSRALLYREGRDERSTTFAVMRSIKDALIPNIWEKIHRLKFLISDAKLDSDAKDEWSAYRGKTRSVEEVARKLTSDYSASLKSFVRLAKAWGIEPILMTQFNRFTKDDGIIKTQYGSAKQQFGYEEFVKLYRLTNNIVRDVASQEGVFLIDLDKEAKGHTEYMYDSVHLNSEGSVFVADRIAHSIATNFPKVFVLK